LFPYPTPDQSVALGAGRVYGDAASDLLIVTYGNGVPMSLRAARAIEAARRWKVRILDLRWLQPLNNELIATHARACKRILVVDEGRRSAGVGEGVVTAIVEGGSGAKPIARVVGEDTYTPLAAAANTVLPSDQSIVAAALALK
jgi:2-oxoisovalerate dehydrogenase E1 component